MFRLSLKSILARKGRMILTALAVIAGTAFLSGVFIFTDTMRGEFNTMFGDAFAKTDAVVRSASSVKGEFDEARRDRMADSMIARVAAAPGVDEAEGGVTAIAAITVGDKIIGQDGPPKLGTSWSPSDASPFTLAEGTAPHGPDQVVIDRGSAKTGKLKVGDQVTITTIKGVRQFTITGIATFSGRDSSLGATWALFDLPVAQEFVTGEPGKIDEIYVTGDGSMSDQQLVESIQKSLNDPSVEVITGAQMTKENQDTISRALDALMIFLVIFALISLFVGSFIIFNVFSISAAQRAQENALLRAVGARRSQVTLAMFTEAVIIGLIGSVLGCLGGIGLAALVLKFLTSANFLPSDTSLSMKPTGFVITVIVGVVVTVLCAIVPAIRSGRVPPLAAMRDVAIDRADMSRKRLIGGVVVLLAAIGSIAAGLTGDKQLLGLGAGLLFVTLIVLGPLLAGPFARALSPLFTRISPVAGRLAARNAERNPKRTALTAGALAIVVALVVTVATMGATAKASVRQIFSESVVADYTVSGKQAQLGLPPTLMAEIQSADSIDALAWAVSFVNMKSTSSADKPASARATVLDGAQAQRILQVNFQSGSFAALNSDTMLVSKRNADDNSIKVGDTYDVTTQNGVTRQVKVAGIVDTNLFGARILSRDLFTDSGQLMLDFAVFVKAADPQTITTLEQIVKKYPTAQLQSRSQYISDQSSQIDGFLNFIYGLLGMSLFIAVIGIVITLLLSVYERRREIGLTRAVGMTRRQVRASVLLESLLTSLLGVLLGAVLGVALGWVVFQAIKDEGLSVYELPMSWVIYTAVGAVLLALAAALWPARKAARSNVLEAIATT